MRIYQVADKKHYLPLLLLVEDFEFIVNEFYKLPAVTAVLKFGNDCKIFNFAYAVGALEYDDFAFNSERVTADLPFRFTKSAAFLSVLPLKTFLRIITTTPSPRFVAPFSATVPTKTVGIGKNAEVW